MRFWKIALAGSLCVALGLSGGAARASLITGLENTGATVPEDAVDPNYTLTAAPTGVTLGNTYVADSSGFQFAPGLWLPNTVVSKWIKPTAGTFVDDPGGGYTFSLSFNVDASTDLNSIAISGQWASDNNADMYLNGGPILNSVAFGSPGSYSFQVWTGFTLTGSQGFQLGTNTLTFVVQNPGSGPQNPTGLRVEFTSIDASATPEPATLASAVLALGIMGLVRFRSRRGR